MSFIQTLERLKRIDALIRRKATGTPAQLAERLDVSGERNGVPLYTATA